MFHEFHSVSDLMGPLRQEAQSRTRHPVRFLVVRGLTAWRAVLEQLALEVDTTLSLSSLCTSDDTFPHLESLVDLLAASQGERVLLLPLAEPLRFRRDFGYVIRMLAAWQNVGYRRVYVPLFEVTDVLARELGAIPRCTDGELPRIWAVKGSGQVSVRVCRFPLGGSGTGVVTGVRAYLRVWEEGGQSNVCFVTDLAPYLEESAGSFSVVVYRDGYGAVAKRIRGWPAVLSRDLGRESDWEWLAREAGEGETLVDLATRVLNVNEYDARQLLVLWRSLDERQRWLVWLWSKVEAPGGTYLRRVIESSRDVALFDQDVANGVLGASLSREMLLERKTLLNRLRVNQLPASFWQGFSGLQDPLQKLACLAGLTSREREEAILALRDLMERGEAESTWWPYLEIAFRELEHYLGSFPFDDGFLQDYFRLYNRSRLMDRPSPELIAMARRAAEEKRIWTYEPRDSLLERVGGAGVAIIWVDGMGLEWAGLVRELLREYGEVEVEVRVARANLPTLTEPNAGWSSEEDVEREIDEIAHRYSYSFPRALVMQMAVVQRVVQKAFGALAQAPEVVITSDHGLTRFAGHAGKVQLPEGAEVGKWGRYAKVSDYATPLLLETNHVVDGDMIVLATHEKFAGGSGLTGEVHGGATLEECLVPVIRVRKGTESLGVRPEVRVLTPQVKLNVHGEGELLLVITVPFREVRVRVLGQGFVGRLETANEWKFSLRGLPTGKQRGRVESERGFVAEIEFELIKGLAERDLGL